LARKLATEQIMNLLKIIVIAGAAAGMAAGMASATLAQGTTNQATAVPSDAGFAQKASMGNKYEIEAGQLALAKATDPKVKDFARMMVTDHSGALKKLEEAARGANMPLPANAALDAAHQAKIDALKGKSGAAFDQQYKTDQKQAHEDTLALLTAYKQNCKNAKLRAWADEALPTVMKHRDAINAM